MIQAEPASWTKVAANPDGAAVVEAAVASLADGGIRGATLRDISQRSQTSVAAMVGLFGSKDRLLEAAFDLAIARDLEKLDQVAGSARLLGSDPVLLPSVLWAMCDDLSGSRRAELIVLTELLLQGAVVDALRPQVRRWIQDRRDRCRAFAAEFGVEAAAIDILQLILLSEAIFAVSCGTDPAWRAIGRIGFDEAAARLLRQPPRHPPEAVAAAAARFYCDPDGSYWGVPAQGWVRNLIVEAAADLVEAEGLSAVTNRSVAERAGVSIASTTYHFKSINDLQFAALLCVFERAFQAPENSLKLTGDLASARRWTGRRQNQSGQERTITRGTVEISLAAARGLIPAEYGPVIRRHRGFLTRITLASAGLGHISRSLIASHALWGLSVYLISAALPDGDRLFDFDGQADRAAQDLLGFA